MVDAAICNGDYVVIRQQPTANNGEIVAAMIDGEATVKTFQRKDGQVWLLPHNEADDPIDGTHATILGKVTAVLRSVQAPSRAGPARSSPAQQGDPEIPGCLTGANMGTTPYFGERAPS